MERGQPNLHYVTGLTGNAVLKALAGEVVEQAQRAYERDGGKITRFHSTRYQAGTWSHSRRVVIKVEVSEQGVNTRFVVTDMEQARTKVLYRHIYCARGQMENDIKDHKLYLKSDRTSCHRFEANQFRLLLHSAAYVLLDTLRREVLQTTPWASATMETIQLRLLKLGARVQECTRLDQDIAALVVPGSAGGEAHFNRVGLCAFDRAAIVSASEEPGGFGSKRLQSAREGNGRGVPPGTMKPVWTVPGQPDKRIIGSKRSCDTVFGGSCASQ